MTSMYIVNSREDKSRATSMAAVVYWTNLNSKHALSAPSISLRVKHVGVNKNPLSDCWLHWTAGRVSKALKS